MRCGAPSSSPSSVRCVPPPTSAHASQATSASPPHTCTIACASVFCTPPACNSNRACRCFFGLPHQNPSGPMHLVNSARTRLQCLADLGIHGPQVSALETLFHLATYPRRRIALTHILPIIHVILFYVSSYRAAAVEAQRPAHDRPFGRSHRQARTPAPSLRRCLSAHRGRCLPDRSRSR